MKRWQVVGLAAGGAVGALLLLGAAPSTADDPGGNCFVIIDARGDGSGGPDQAVLGENSQCFDTREELNEATRRLGLRD